MPKYPVTKNMGAALRNLRQQRKVKAVDLAKSINKTGAYISKLEKGDLNLDESVKKFEEGMKISKECSKILEEAEHKITILTKDSEGNLKEEAFDAQ